MHYAFSGQLEYRVKNIVKTTSGDAICSNLDETVLFPAFLLTKPRVTPHPVPTGLLLRLPNIPAWLSYTSRASSLGSQWTA